ncbi:hypothetical protein [Nocardia goodfellowii]|uniref:Uncharacterized protein n=1 Tax=Nocardia goodfellowii TaxID=882446 RepID=A0ABS4QKK3_9NOCA|nr:hypothetical protein [Nocardia goodfellowii]MBP2191574.1 hypothetical protein [Nocardia goodfellowii]
MQTRPATDESRDRSAPVAYAEFGRTILRTAVSPDRVNDLVAEIIGDRIELGPMAAGPGNMATVSVTGRRGRITTCPAAEGDWDVEVTVVMDLEAGLEFAGVSAAFAAVVCAGTRIRLEPRADCYVFVDVDHVRPDDVTARIIPSDMAARVLDRLGALGAEVTGQVIRYVEELMTGPEVMQLRHIDLAAVITRAWDSDLVLDTTGIA